MIDKHKLQKLSDIIVNYSVQVKKGDKILIRGYGFDSYPLIKLIYTGCIKKGAIQVDVRFSHSELSRIFMEQANKKQLQYITKLDKDIAESYDAMVQIVADSNPYEMSGIDIKKLNMRQKTLKPISDILHKKRWCLFYYPNTAYAHVAKKSLEGWEDFVLDSCIKDWSKEEKLQKQFVKVMQKIKTVRVIGKDTDLTYSIKNQKWKTCSGRCNLPDGEIFTSPIKDSVNGYIKFNVPTRYMSKDFEWIKLTFKDGKVIKEEANANTKELSDILNTDNGARYVGECAFGLNNKVKEATTLIIFDEKMGKSMHMALGKCYEEAPNGNDSNIHWDMIFNFIWANAKIYFDDKPVFAGGRWIDKKLLFLNKCG